jgi:hypothetical protein
MINSFLNYQIIIIIIPYEYTILFIIISKDKNIYRI